MADNPHFVSEGVQLQSPDEQLVYTITTTNQASSPTVSSVKAYDKDNDDTEVTSTVLSGSSSVSGDVITLPVVKSLTIKRTYWVHVIWTSGSNTFESIVSIKCQY